ncbi:hypothetical protein HGM15179_016888 [Zosterops borbonicus]|uniref:CCHC-type domain-containing protein n=1 Tax=Zosterops borbonicus TaxID=364589 RepID=A0A8K1LDS8_9PASS|nr:hypothetical protein HGM15179_016888 [Zosterops borbonicus]
MPVSKRNSSRKQEGRECPKEALDGPRNAARQAFFKVPDVKTPQKAFTTIVQGPQEPYMQFVDRLKQAIECQIDNADAREILLLKLAVENANTDCKKLPKSLLKQDPSLVEMDEACNQIGTIEHQYEAAAFAAAKGTFGSAEVCYGCSKPDHLKKDCLARKRAKLKAPDSCPRCHKGRRARKRAKLKAPDLCPRCHKGRRFANQCRSKYDSEGCLVQGNQNPNPPIVRHFGNNSKLEVKQKAPVLIKDPETARNHLNQPLPDQGERTGLLPTCELQDQLIPETAGSALLTASWKTQKQPEDRFTKDVDSVRHMTLQNRAAIDVLLLAHGHGCEDFEGLCCMNLFDNSLSIHANIQALRDSVAKLKCVQRLIDKSTKKILMVEQKGGDVGIQLESRAGSTAQLMTEMDMLALLTAIFKGFGQNA